MDLYSKRGGILMDEPYKRPSEDWSIEKQKLFIDSIINGFDVPKFYLRNFNWGRQIDGKWFDYSMIDGRQRLRAIVDFIHCKFALADDFVYLRDKSYEVGGKIYNELPQGYLDVMLAFDSYTLDIVEIDTNDLKSVDEMFARLDGNTTSYSAVSNKTRPVEELVS